MGKSSLVKAAHAEAVAQGLPLVLVEIAREDLDSVGRLLATLGKATDKRFVLFADDLSFSHDDTQYKSLKAVLDGGLAGRPDNVILYATSNRRHLMPRDMIDNERATAIHPGEAVEEKVSLSDRFGLWLSSLRAGRISADDSRLLRCLRVADRRRSAARRGDRVAGHARRPFRPGGVAILHRSGRA